MQRLAQTDTGALSFPIRLVGGAESAKVALWNLFSAQAQDEMEPASDGVADTIKGEWPFDLSFGMRWRGIVLRKYFSDSDTRALVGNTANLVPEIIQVSPSQVTVTHDPDSRGVRIVLASVRLTSGETVPEIVLVLAA